jgi:short-subunit dehydrogenase
MKNTEPKTAIVTGASRGIGYAIADYFASVGYHLLLVSQNPDTLQTAAQTLIKKYPALPQPSLAAMDVSDYEKVKGAVNLFAATTGKIDILCNNAGYAKRGSSDLAHDEFLKMININLVGAFNFIQSVTPFMKDKNQGRIINIASRSGKIARKLMGGYAASKFGLIGFNEAIHKELFSHGISVTAICPGLVATDMTDDVRIEKSKMIQTSDIVKTIEYLLQLSPTVAIKEIIIECGETLLTET